MTVEYILLVAATFMFALKMFISTPMKVFKESGPKLGARVESQLVTGRGFSSSSRADVQWKKER